MESRKQRTHSEMLSRSRELRSEMTAEERHLWYVFLKTLPVVVKRQKIIGPYIVDFYIASRKLVIELDGSQHYEEKNRLYDKQRDAFLRERGLSVVRYTNDEVNRNFRSVCEDIWKRLGLS